MTTHGNWTQDVAKSSSCDNPMTLPWILRRILFCDFNFTNVASLITTDPELSMPGPGIEIMKIISCNLFLKISESF